MLIIFCFPFNSILKFLYCRRFSIFYWLFSHILDFLVLYRSLCLTFIHLILFFLHCKVLFYVVCSGMHFHGGKRKRLYLMRRDLKACVPSHRRRQLWFYKHWVLKRICRFILRRVIFMVVNKDLLHWELPSQRS